MKKIIALFLVLSLCIGVTSCGGKKTANGDSVHVKWYLFTSSADSDNTEAFANAAKIAKDKFEQLRVENSGVYRVERGI